MRSRRQSMAISLLLAFRRAGFDVDEAVGRPVVAPRHAAKPAPRRDADDADGLAPRLRRHGPALRVGRTTRHVGAAVEVEPALLAAFLAGAGRTRFREFDGLGDPGQR